MRAGLRSTGEWIPKAPVLSIRNPFIVRIHTRSQTTIILCMYVCIHNSIVILVQPFTWYDNGNDNGDDKILQYIYIVEKPSIGYATYSVDIQFVNMLWFALSKASWNSKNVNSADTFFWSFCQVPYVTWLLDDYSDKQTGSGTNIYLGIQVSDCTWHTQLYTEILTTKWKGDSY